MITINGVTFSGSNITVSKGKIIIDGKDVTPDSKNINITVNGNINSVEVDVCDKFTITGDVDSVQTASGDVDIKGNAGSINTMSGDVDCWNVKGSIRTMSGDIRHKL